MLIYDFKYDDLTRIAYNALLQHGHIAGHVVVLVHSRLNTFHGIISRQARFAIDVNQAVVDELELQQNR